MRHLTPKLGLLWVLLLASCGKATPYGTGDANTGQDAQPADAAFDAPGDAAPLMLTVDPPTAELTVDGVAKTLQFNARLAGQPAPTAVWTVDAVEVGVVNNAGLFRSEGWVAGTVKVTARFGALSASAIVVVKTAITDNQANLDAADRAALDAGGTANSAFAWRYPYNQTVFPRGLDAPLLQFAGGATRAMKISARVGDFTYTGYLPGGAFANAQLPASVWKALTRSADGSQPVVVEATMLSDAGVTGPVTQQWKIAPADLKGIIYYNTYRSAQTNTGAVMRVKPGHNAEVMIGGCNVCHSVSANGNVVAAGVSWASGNPVDSATYDLAADGSYSVRNNNADGRLYSFGGLTPNGEYMVTNAIPAAGSPVRGLSGPMASTIVNTATGAAVAAPTFTVSAAVTPAFSPDGKKLAFAWFDQSPGRTLGVMSADLTQSPPMFGAPTTLATTATGIVGWPSFLPDGNGVVYHQGDRFDTAGYGGAASYAELRLVDTQTGVVNSLARLNGRDALGASTLPYGADEENNRNYEPSVLPIPVGGYYWVMFTSRRAYGNELAPGGRLAGSDNEWGSIVNGAEVPSTRKKIWVAAIDLNWNGAIDPSHPAFYLAGQELDAGNMRAFAAMEPCRAQGVSCETGADCCTGFCRPTGASPDGAPILQCVPPPGGCSQTDETCSNDGDCCDAATGATCINNRCAQATPIE